MKGKIRIIKIIKENEVAALITPAAVAAIIIYIAILMPLSNKVRARYLECGMYEGQAANARKLIEVSQKIAPEYQSRVLVSEQQAAVGIEEFTRHGKSLGINFLSLKPKNIIKPESALYKILPVELSFEANGGQFVKFIGSIDELKNAIVTVKSFNLAVNSDDRKKLIGNMVVDIYLSPEEGDS